MTDKDRARDDAKTSNDFGRAGAQASILINGGAATALLASAHRSDVSAFPLSYVLASSLFIYALGVLLAAMAFPYGSQAIEHWMLYHQGDEIDKNKTQGERKWNLVMRFVFSSLTCFAVGSALLAVGSFWERK